MTLYTFANDPRRPVCDRAGSENTDPAEPLCRTTANYESIRVALVDSVAIRIIGAGYCVLMKCPDGVFRRLGSSELRTDGLTTLDQVYYVLDMLRADGKITPREDASLRDQMADWPAMSVVAWAQLHPCITKPLPPFAPDGLEAVRANLRGY